MAVVPCSQQCASLCPGGKSSQKLEALLFKALNSPTPGQIHPLHTSQTLLGLGISLVSPLQPANAAINHSKTC